MNWLLLKNSLLVAGGATLVAAVPGTAAAVFMRGAGGRLRKGTLLAAILALVMPPFLTVNCWLHYLGGPDSGQSWLPLDLHSTAGAILLLALMTWPVTTLAVHGALHRLEPALLEADPAVRGRHLMRGILFPMARTALLRAALVTFVLALNNFTIPAILQVKVYPAEVWVLFNTELNAVGAFAMSWPMIVAPLAALFWLTRGDIAWPAVNEPVSGALFRRQMGGMWHGLAGLVTLPVCVLSAGLPLWQIASVKRTWTELPGALAAGGGAVWTSFWLPAVTATLVVAGTLAVLVLARFAGFRGRVPGWRIPKWTVRMAGVLIWLPFFTPGVLLGIALILVFNRPVFESFYQSFGIVLLALAARYVAVGGWGVVRAMRMTDRNLTDAARMEGVSCWRMLRQVWWPQIRAQVFAAWYVVYLLCLWDVESVVMIVPPGGETLALRIFNLLHYGHNAQVNALCLTLLILAILPLLAGMAVHGLVKMAGRCCGRTALAVCASAALLAVSGCSPSSSPHEAELESRIFRSVRVIGTRGAGPGQFNKPRSVVTDRAGNLYAVDMTGRVQKYSADGEYLLAWQMPQTDLGRPKGLACDRQGNVVVLEPHYHRVNHFSTNGVLVGIWGTHGTNTGELSFPRAVAVNSRGEIWTSEYGLVERVQRFAVELPAVSPTTASTNGTNRIPARLLLSVGSPGMDPGQFNRPEGLCVDAQDRLYVADSCNHRIQVFDNEGHFLRQFGRPGHGRGELSYPYDVAVDRAGRCYVCEFGNNRVQVFDTNGAPLEILGGAGAGPGRFANPWGLALDPAENLYVADSQNHRVQKLVRR
jgi:ABC-type Fe3+ transport system permease subunit/DNA-binding beta-propeller fold protein YncE